MQCMPTHTYACGLACPWGSTCPDCWVKWPNDSCKAPASSLSPHLLRQISLLWHGCHYTYQSQSCSSSHAWVQSSGTHGGPGFSSGCPEAPGNTAEKYKCINTPMESSRMWWCHAATPKMSHMTKWQAGHLCSHWQLSNKSLFICFPPFLPQFFPPPLFCSHEIVLIIKH